MTVPQTIIEPHDYAEPFRRDAKNMLPDIVVEYAKRHIVSLRALKSEASDVEKAIADVRRFISEHES